MAFAERLGRALTTTAEMAAPFVMQDLRTKAQAQRDARLAEVRSRERHEDRTFQAEENEKRMTLQKQIEADRLKAQADRDAATASYREKQLAVAEREAARGDTDRQLTAEYRRDRLAIAQQELDATKEGEALRNQLAQLKLDQEEDRQKALKLLLDPKTTDVQRAAAIDYLAEIAGENKVHVRQLEDDAGKSVAVLRGTNVVDVVRPDGTTMAGQGPAQQPGVAGVAQAAQPGEPQPTPEQIRQGGFPDLTPFGFVNRILQGSRAESAKAEQNLSQQGPPATGPGSLEQPYPARSDAEYDAIPMYHAFRDPGDGQVYIKQPKA